MKYMPLLPLLPYLGLFFEKLPLLHGVIQLGVGIAYFLLHDKKLKALSQTLFRSVPGDKRPTGRFTNNLPSSTNMSS